jgi:hypothetical protein
MMFYVSFYVPRIVIQNNICEVYAYGIRYSRPHTTRLVQKKCRHSPSIIPYVCECNREVLEDILWILKKKGFDRVELCLEGKCREIPL